MITLPGFWHRFNRLSQEERWQYRQWEIWRCIIYTYICIIIYYMCTWYNIYIYILYTRISHMMYLYVITYVLAFSIKGVQYHYMYHVHIKQTTNISIQTLSEMCCTIAVTSGTTWWIPPSFGSFGSTCGILLAGEQRLGMIELVVILPCIYHKCYK